MNWRHRFGIGLLGLCLTLLGVSLGIGSWVASVDKSDTRPTTDYEHPLAPEDMLDSTPKTALTGVVQDPDGEPIPNARICALQDAREL